MQFSHPYIADVLAVNDATAPVCIIMELCEGGDVSQLWTKSPGFNAIAPPLQWRILYELAQAINVLHTRTPPMMHRDIKGANVFLDKDLHVKLADFDLVLDAPTSDQLCGTPGYMGPEVMDARCYDLRCDVFAYAGVCYEVTHGCYPFSKEASLGADFFEKTRDFITRGVRPNVAPSVPAKMAGLMQDCWQSNPTKRPPMSQVLARLQAMKGEFQ